VIGLVIFTHRELLARKPFWRNYLPTGDCAGVYRVVDDSTRSWTAQCDRCGDEIAITPTQQHEMIAQARRLAGES